MLKQQAVMLLIFEVFYDTDKIFEIIDKIFIYIIGIHKIDLPENRCRLKIAEFVVAALFTFIFSLRHSHSISLLTHSLSLSICGEYSKTEIIGAS